MDMPALASGKRARRAAGCRSLSQATPRPAVMATKLMKPGATYSNRHYVDAVGCACSKRVLENWWWCRKETGCGAQLAPPQQLELPMNRSNWTACASSSSSHVDTPIALVVGLHCHSAHCPAVSVAVARTSCAAVLETCTLRLDVQQGPSPSPKLRLARPLRSEALRDPASSSTPYRTRALSPPSHGYDHDDGSTLARSISRSAAVRPARYRPLPPACSSILTPCISTPHPPAAGRLSSSPHRTARPLSGAPRWSLRKTHSRLTEAWGPQVDAHAVPAAIPGLRRPARPHKLPCRPLYASRARQTVTFWSATRAYQLHWYVSLLCACH